MALPIKSPLNSLGLTSAPGSLQAFYNKIGSNYSIQKDNFVNYINVPKFFDISIKNIKPGPTSQTADVPKGFSNKNSSFGDWWDATKSSASSQWGEFKNSFSKEGRENAESARKQREYIENGSTDAFLKFIEERYNPNLSNLTNICTYIGVDLDKDFKYYVQNVKLPNLKIDTEYISNFTSPEPIGKDGVFIVPENNNITISLLDMAAPLHEYLFYPWLAEVGLSQWMYNTMPFTKADIVINFMFPNYTAVEEGQPGIVDSFFTTLANKISENSGDNPLSRPSFQYIFKNCYPTRMDLLSPSNTISDTFTRDVDFAFSHLIIKTSGVVVVDAAKKIANALSNRVINPAMNKGLQPITGNSILPSTSL